MNKFTLEEPTQIDAGAVMALIQNFEKISRKRISNKKLQKIKPVRIRFDGNFIETFSRKTIWKRKGDASNALALYLEGCFEPLFKYVPRAGAYSADAKSYKGPDNKYYSHKEKEAICAEAKRQIKYRLIEFVEVNE